MKAKLNFFIYIKLYPNVTSKVYFYNYIFCFTVEAILERLDLFFVS